MKVLIQRVKYARVRVDEKVAGEIGGGLLVLLGVHREDSRETARRAAVKTAALRVFEDESGKMNRSLLDTGGGALVVSQFTLYADTRKGNRPGFADAAPGEAAELLYRAYVEDLQEILGAENVHTGVFAAYMQVELLNDGPVTILLDMPP